MVWPSYGDWVRVGWRKGRVAWGEGRVVGLSPAGFWVRFDDGREELFSDEAEDVWIIEPDDDSEA